jgi:hypothetical protein
MFGRIKHDRRYSIIHANLFEQNLVAVRWDWKEIFMSTVSTFVVCHCSLLRINSRRRRRVQFL